MLSEKNEKPEYVIWGAGKLGNLAYDHFKSRVQISFYVDSDERKWYTRLNDIPVYPPEALKEKKRKVIIALKKGRNDIAERLHNEYGIFDYTEFSFIETDRHIANRKENELENNSVIVCCLGGLGNQMFQYALYRNLQQQGKNVYLDVSYYNTPRNRVFLLDKVFPYLKMKICSEEQRIQHTLSQCCGKISELHNFQIYVEPSLSEENIKKNNPELYKIDNGIIKGYHQCYQYVQEIGEILLQELLFDKCRESKLVTLSEQIKSQNAISIHIRRGDYLRSTGVAAFGNICTTQYYNNAIQILKERINNPVFYFFSNDMDWVRENFRVPDSVYIDGSLFDNYDNWYDMYLMSVCKHNIIANSSFSWWGAWLNQNPNKIVIAPGKWNNICDYQDICPKDWTRINEQGEIM